LDKIRVSRGKLITEGFFCWGESRSLRSESDIRSLGDEIHDNAYDFLRWRGPRGEMRGSLTEEERSEDICKEFSGELCCMEEVTDTDDNGL